MNYNKRTHMCGELRITDAGKKAIVCGWVARQRSLSGRVFVVLRDTSGTVQIKFDENDKFYETACQLRSEWVICISGNVIERESKNPNMLTGDIEIVTEHLEVLSKSNTPPFEIEDETKANELLRLEYRYLDLRRPVMQKYLKMRSKITQAVRRFYDQNDFYEIETPILTKSTPEGSRDYLVPSRLHPGKFYALPQSPQQYKQLLMISGMNKYFQIARCLRDEDLRADRQPDFTQIDVEMSFVDMDDVLNINEKMISSIFQEILGVEITLPLQRMPYAEAIERFGSDKPDLRFGFELKDITEIAKNSGFKVFNSANAVGAIVLDGFADKLGRKDIDALTEFVKGLGLKGLAWHKGETSSFAKFMTPDEMTKISNETSFKQGDVLFVIADEKESLVKTSLGSLRLECAKRLGLLKDNKDFKFLWITEFPMFEYSEEEGRLVAQHHPFTSPIVEDIPLLDIAPEKVRTRAYDMVVNGYELCSGSIRIHDADLQAKMFSILQIPEKDMQARFGHLLRAFQYGVPPHGGIGFGFDRIIMIMCGTDNIRDVVAFPKTQSAVEMMMNSPDFVDQKQLDELGIKIVEKAEGDC